MNARRDVLLRLALFLAVAAVSSAFSWARVRFNQVYEPGALERVAGLGPSPEAGEAPSHGRRNWRGGATPFQYRVLVPKLARFVSERAPGRPPLRAVFHALDAAALVGAFYALKKLARDLFESERIALATALGLFYALPFHFLFSRIYPFWFAWDVAALFVLVYGLRLLRARAWIPYYLLFAVGTFNRETTCFLTVAHVLTSWRAGARARTLAHAAAQLAIWIAVKWLLQWLYRRAPGPDQFQAVWSENLQWLAEPRAWGTLALAFGGLWLPLIALARFVREPWIRRALLVVPVFALGISFTGVWVELRIWGEVVPLVLLGVVAGWLGWRARRIATSAAAS